MITISVQEFDSSKNDQLSKDDFCKMYDGIIHEKKVQCTSWKY